MTTTLNEVGAAQARLDELTQALDDLGPQTESTTSSLGVAVADRDEKQAASLRDDLGQQDALRRELEAAIPVASQRLQEAQARAQAAQAIDDARKANADRMCRLEAARKLDAALRALGRAFDEHMACEPGGTAKDREAVPNRLRRHYRTALYKWHPEMAHFLSKALNAPRVPGRDVRSLEDCEARTITEFDVDDA